MKTVPLEIITPDKVFYSHDVSMIVCDLLYGKEGFLPGHSRVVKLLGEECLVRIKEAGEGDTAVTERTAAVRGGHLLISDSFQIFTPEARWL